MTTNIRLHATRTGGASFPPVPAMRVEGFQAISVRIIACLLLISSWMFSAEGAQVDSSDDRPLLVVLSKASDMSEYWMAAFDGQYKVIYFVLKKKGDDPIASPGSMAGVVRGPSLENAFVHIELKPLTIRLIETNKGRSLRLTREGDMVPFEKVKTGMITDINKNIVACYRVKNDSALPRKQEDLAAITPETLRHLKGIGAVEFGFETSAEEILRQGKSVNSDGIVP